ncbi:3-oxoacyl-[ACP] synthase III in alkane synthesis cluster [Enhygromyxa salina]|uniref:3-oxoacyl-[ACP] synthase III in alkane synthesis cluster n=1 Tax=Enhygromyxa salina TaxID=215803 RepID=A0A0C1ZWN1_9BACT|nr:3-oxoacyl-ACP synthase III [Enhygromyxa salina]KIG15463.1 3-oxoacyl-[ACP] synthase III in alkane synthesis cluster [Enhygromyxa salina]
MRFDNVSICSVAHVDAPDRVTSAELERRLAGTMKRLHVPPGLLEGLTGITARRMWPEGTQPSDAATLAGRRALAAAHVDPQRVGILINTSVCRDYVEPSTACLVHAKLGLSPACINFDVGNACLGFLNGMEIVGNMIERGQLDYGLVVDGESSRYVVDQTIARLTGEATDQPSFWANFATLTLGSAGVAMVLTRADLAPSGHRFLGGVTVAATQHSDLCRGQIDRMETHSGDLLNSGLELAQQTWAAAQRELGWNPGALDEYVIHQVSKVHTDKFRAAFEIEPQRLLATYPEYGNVGPAGVPLVLSKAAELGRLHTGDRIALMGIGSGLNCAMAEVVW